MEKWINCKLSLIVQNKKQLDLIIKHIDNNIIIKENFDKKIIEYFN